MTAVGGGCSTVYAQSSPQFSIFDSFEDTTRKNKGVVIIHQSDAIRQLVGTRIDNENVVVVTGKTFLITEGYRIQAYLGNNSRVSREEATTLQTEIKELFPDIEADLRYSAPFWKLHVGNFLSYEEAYLMLRELRRIYPQKKNEIFIIEDDIQMPLD